MCRKGGRLVLQIRAQSQPKDAQLVTTLWVLWHSTDRWNGQVGAPENQENHHKTKTHHQISEVLLDHGTDVLVLVVLHLFLLNYDVCKLIVLHM